MQPAFAGQGMVAKETASPGLWFTAGVLGHDGGMVIDEAWLLVAPMLALVLALLAMSAIVQGGGLLLRWLGMPAEAPEIYRYSPPATPPQPGPPDRAAARARGEARRALQERYLRAQHAFVLWLRTVEVAHALPDQQEAAKERQRADDLHRQLEALLPQLSGDAAPLAKLEGLIGSFEAMLKQLSERLPPAPASRSKIWLILGLGLVLIWLLVIVVVMP
ncbi:MAG: hypothetical protein EA402_01200 [Planctomycetota bacterium]|nr:MAG: hypothetical protein EA402_01200 [Planctomycetota bacterium]